jgi:hypothetical protein
MSAILGSLLAMFPNTTAQAVQSPCKTYNFKEIFYADYKTGSHWDNSSGHVEITWSAQGSLIGEEKITRAFSVQEMSWVRSAFQSWDSALHTVSFVEVDTASSPQIVIGYVDLIPSTVQPTAVGFWTASIVNSSRQSATIKLKSESKKWFSNSRQFTHTVQHELGNVLGLGDITPTSNLDSVLEDPWQPPYGAKKLSSIDLSLIRQLYGETLCTRKAKATSPDLGKGSQPR